MAGQLRREFHGDGRPDTIEGDIGDETLDGLGGNDSIRAFGGNDLVIGGGGDDSLFGNRGNDTLVGGEGDDALIGGDDRDVADYQDADGAVAINLNLGGYQNTGSAGFDRLVMIERVTGSQFADTLTGDSTDNVLTGLDGADTLKGRDGSDVLNGGAGADSLVGGDASDGFTPDGGGVANDTILGGAGNDIVHYSGAAITVDLRIRTAQDTGGAGTDLIIGVEVVNSGEFDDDLTGNAVDNSLGAAGGSDELTGLGGDDTLDGGAGEDTIMGGSGADSLLGGTGVDRLIGGADGDVFRFLLPESGTTAATRDVIADLESGSDTVDLSNIDADVNQDGDQGFDFIDSEPFSGAAGELRVTSVNGHVVAWADVDGDAEADFSILFANIASVAETDFLL